MRTNGQLYLILAIVCCFSLIACSSQEEWVEESEKDLCRVYIQIGASENQETRAGDDENALDGEFIHELCVFVVNGDGKIVWKGTDDEEGAYTKGDPASGNAYEWRSRELVLTEGKKTIYAFANWSTVTEGQDNGKWNAIINKSVGGTLSNAELAITIDNPAGSVDLAKGQYIPMSVKQEVNVTVDQTIRVELVRLVGRVNIQLINAKASQISVTGFTMSNFANKVALMPEETATDVAYDQSYSTFSVKDPQVITGNNGAYPFSFYVNETKNGTPFSIQLIADKKNYSATTTAMAIPRNHILPLNLTLREGDLSLIVMAYIAPIGGYPVPIYTSEDLLNKNEFAVEVPEGCSFQAIAKVGGNEASSVCEFSHLEGATSAKNIQIDGNDPSWAYVTALSDLSESLNVSVIGTGYTCKLNISTEALKDWGEGGYPIPSSLRQWQAKPTLYELVPLRMANPE